MKVTRTFEGDHQSIQADGFRGKPAFGFLGSAIDFPRRVLTVVEADLEGIIVERFDSLREIDGHLQRRGLNMHCLAVHEARADDLLERYDDYVAAAQGAKLVFAYSDGDIAQRIRDSEFGEKLGYLPMQCALDAWTAYIRLLVCDEPFLPKELLRPTQPVAESKPVSPLLARLTDREHQVLRHVAEGHRNRCIAEMLNLSEHTVKLHLHNCFSKLGVSNRAAAAVWYQSQGLST